jgi:hypothetical protein
MGFGVVRVQGKRVDMQPLCNHLLSLSGTNTYPNLPALATLFFTQIRVDSYQREKTFNLKYDLRALFRQDGRRSDSHTRPYLLDELSRFENMWAALRLLERTQTYQIIQTIEATRALWFGNDADARSLDDPTFRQFVSDTLADAPWPDDKKWWAFDDHEREQLIDAGVRGELADLAELYFELLKQKD